MKKHLVLLLLTVLSLHFAACTSSDEATSEDAAVTDESLENVDGTDTAASPDANAEGFSDEVGGDTSGEEIASEAPPADGGELPPADAGGDIPPPMDASAMGEAPAGDTAFVPDAGVDPATTDAAPPPAEEIPPPVADTTPISEPPPAPTEVATHEHGSGIFEEKPKPAPLRKIETTPFRRDGVLLNAVYIARPGDNFSKISKNIYGDNSKSKELRKVNPGLAPKVGDKVYYNSPLRAEDESNLKVYFEDIGLPSETYVMQEGDDFRKKSKELLGHDGSWREIYVTNNMDSTRNVPAGTEIRYWKGGSAGAPPPAVDVAQAPPPPPPQDMAPPPTDMPPPPMDMPPPPMDMPPPEMMGEAPPPMDMPPPEMMAEQMPPPEMAPPPPPPPEMAPPPPPPPAMAAQTGDMGGGNDDLMLALAGGGGVAALLAGLMVMRKRRQQREMAAAFGDTQVGT